MTKKSVVILVISIIIALAVGGTGGYFIGFRRADIPKTSFYANILEIDDIGGILVEGIPENDINHRGKFRLSFKRSASVTDENGSSIAIDGLESGSLVRVTYTGSVLEISPAVISEVLNITIIPD